MGRRSRASREPVPDDAPISVADRDPELPPLWAATHEAAAVEAPRKGVSRSRAKPRPRKPVPPAAIPVSVRQLARARGRLRRLGVRLVLLTFAILIVLAIIDSAAGGHARASGHTFPALWEPRVSDMGFGAAAVCLAFSFLIRLLPGGEAASKLEHFFRRPRLPARRAVTGDLPPGGSGLAWQVLAVLVALGLAIGILVHSASAYEPDASVSLAGLTGQGLQPHLLVTSYPYSYNRGHPQIIRSIRSDPDYGVPDSDVEDSDFDVSGTVERFSDAGKAAAAATAFTDDVTRSQHYANDVITHIDGATVDRVDAYAEVQVGLASGTTYVEINVDSGYLDDETSNRSTSDGDRRAAQAVVAARALAAAAPTVLDVGLPWWR